MIPFLIVLIEAAFGRLCHFQLTHFLPPTAREKRDGVEYLQFIVRLPISAQALFAQDTIETHLWEAESMKTVYWLTYNEGLRVKADTPESPVIMPQTLSLRSGSWTSEAFTIWCLCEADLCLQKLNLCCMQEFW